MPSQETGVQPGAGTLSYASSSDAKVRKRFNLPEDDILQDFYVCAYLDHKLRQGLLYVTLHHVCFYCPLRGFQKKVKIPLQNVEAVERKAPLFIPNSISVKCWGKEHFFTSFLLHSREPCFDLLVKTWEREKAADPTGTGSSLASVPLEPTPQPVQDLGDLVAWPIVNAPLPDIEVGDGPLAWSPVLQHTIKGWELAEVLQIFDADDPFFPEWHHFENHRDLVVGAWEAGPEGIPQRSITYVAFTQPYKPECVQRQVGFMLPSGTFRLDTVQEMPKLTMAQIKVEFVWLMSPSSNPSSKAQEVDLKAYQRISITKTQRFMVPIIKNSTAKSTGESYQEFKKRLEMRFPPKEVPRDHSSGLRAAAEATYATVKALALQASERMPAEWREHIQQALGTADRRPVQVFHSMLQWGRTLCLVAVTMMVLQRVVLPLFGGDAAAQHAKEKLQAWARRPASPAHPTHGFGVQVVCAGAKNASKCTQRMEWLLSDESLPLEMVPDIAEDSVEGNDAPAVEGVKSRLGWKRRQ